jgi:hypothetical protein
MQYCVPDNWPVDYLDLLQQYIGCMSKEAYLDEAFLTIQDDSSSERKVLSLPNRISGYSSWYNSNQETFHIVLFSLFLLASQEIWLKSLMKLS